MLGLTPIIPVVCFVKVVRWLGSHPYWRDPNTGGEVRILLTKEVSINKTKLQGRTTSLTNPVSAPRVAAIKQNSKEEQHPYQIRFPFVVLKAILFELAG